MNSVTTKFVFASIYILFTFLLISGVSVKAEDLCASLAETAECPCNYDVVPQTTACWGECKNCTGNPVFQPCLTSDCDSPTDACALYQINLINGSINDLSVYSKRLGGTNHFIQLCNVRVKPTKDCRAGPNSSHQLTVDQALTCLCRLAQYANELPLEVNIDSTQIPPYSCDTP